MSLNRAGSFRRVWNLTGDRQPLPPGKFSWAVNQASTASSPETARYGFLCERLPLRFRALRSAVTG
jgi:hypothetical protein